MTGIFLFSGTAMATDIFHNRPPNHAQNHQKVADAYRSNLERYRKNPKVLVLPGLLADCERQRVLVTVEATGLGPDSPCEHMMVGEDSEHAYEAILISMAQPGAIQQALGFIGKVPGTSVHPAGFRYWPRGESMELTVTGETGSPVRLEDLVLDRRTGTGLPPQGFRFVGSIWGANLYHHGKKVVAADIEQPMSIVSLFNTANTVLEVPRLVGQSEAYQNTTVNPQHALLAGALQTLVIEPMTGENFKGAKDLVLKVDANHFQFGEPLTGLERLKNLSFQLKAGAVVLNDLPTISSVMEALGRLDRHKNEYYRTLSWGGDVELGAAQALATLLATVDCERGVRVEPPLGGQFYYRAFTPDRDVLDRETRLYNPLEMVIIENRGAIAGRLVNPSAEATNEVRKLNPEPGGWAFANSRTLVKALHAEAKLAVKSGQRPGLPVILVHAPATLKYGQLVALLKPVLADDTTVYIYLNEPMPPTAKQ